MGAGGAPINYAEVSRLVLASRDLAPRCHDFHALVAQGGDQALRGLVAPGDTVICTAGPWAHLYHYWRERAGLDFRIVRDARTTAWTPYLAQEWLAASLLRPGDCLILPSEFARAFYARLFPHLHAGDTCVLYPLAPHLPAAGEPRAAPAGALRIGCLGRIADDKNTVAAFDLLRTVQADRPAELHLAGAFYPRGRELAGPADLHALAAHLGIAPGSVIYHGDLPYQEIWRFLGGLDVLYFPAVSSNESFGRVLLEAGRAGVPVIATDYAAAGELVPRENLVGVRYRHLAGACITQPITLGAPDTAAAAAILAGQPAAEDRSGDPRFSGAAFLDLVRGGRRPAAGAFTPSPGTARFLAGVAIPGLDPPDRPAALELCATQLGFLRDLYARGPLRRLGAIGRMLHHLPGHPLLRRVARERLFGSAPAGVLRNGVAAALAIGFDPRLSLAAEAGA